jgi:hypothetical protein
VRRCVPWARGLAEPWVAPLFSLLLLAFTLLTVNPVTRTIRPSRSWSGLHFRAYQLHVAFGVLSVKRLACLSPDLRPARGSEPSDDYSPVRLSRTDSRTADRQAGPLICRAHATYGSASFPFRYKEPNWKVRRNLCAQFVGYLWENAILASSSVNWMDILRKKCAAPFQIERTAAPRTLPARRPESASVAAAKGKV